MKSDREIIFENIKKSLTGLRKEVVDTIILDNVIREKLDDITPQTQNGLVKQFENELKKVNSEFINIEKNEAILSTLKKLLSDNGVEEIAVCNSDFIINISKSLEGIKVLKAIEYSYQERKDKLSKIETALVFAETGIADTGSTVFFYDVSKTTYPHFLSNWIIVFIKKDSIVPNQFELMKNIDKEKAKNMVFVTGPSRTADIEKELVLGAHGPRRVTIIVIP